MAHGEWSWLMGSDGGSWGCGGGSWGVVVAHGEWWWLMGSGGGSLGEWLIGSDTSCKLTVLGSNPGLPWAASP